MEIADSLRSLHQKKAILRYPDVSNDLNCLYQEGLKATEDGHYKERRFPDLSFAQPCDECGVEITFIMFTCLGCRNMSLCEPCYFRQLQIEEEPSDESSICESERSRSVSPLAGDAHLIYAARNLKMQKRAPIKRRQTMKEHTKNHVFLRSYDYQEQKVHFSSHDDQDQKVHFA